MTPFYHAGKSLWIFCPPVQLDLTTNLYFRLPVSMIIAVFTIINDAIALPTIHPSVWLFLYAEIVVNICVFILCLVAFIGLFKWKHNAWLAQQIALIMVPAYQLFFAISMQIISQKYPSINSAQSWGNFIGSALVNILIFIYYQKRKLLFSNAAGVREETITFIDPAKIDPSVPVAHTSSQQDDTILTASQSILVHQSECIRTYPDFNYSEEMNNKKTGETFSKLLDSGIDMKTAYEFVHRNDVNNPPMAPSADQAQIGIPLSKADKKREADLNRVSERLAEIRQQAEHCKQIHPDFDYINEMDDPISGKAFSKLIYSGVDVCSAYTIVHQILNDDN